MEKSTTEYLNNKDFTILVLAYLDNKTNENRDKVFHALDLIATNLVKRYHFKPLEKEDLKHEMIMTAFMKLDRFTLGKGNCFSYFTTIMLNKARYCWRTNSKYASIEERYKIKLIQEQSNNRRKVNKKTIQTEL